LNQAQALRGSAHAYHVGGLHRDAGLAIESEEYRFRVAGQMHFDGAGVAYDDGPVRQRVRADGRDDPGLDAGMDNGTAGGKRVGRRARGRGYDQAVGAVAADKIGIDGEVEVNHARQGALVDDCFIHDALPLDHVSVAVQFDVKHDSLAAGESAGEDLFQCWIHFLDLEAGQEAEAAHVDGENRNAERGGEAGRGEERAVAAEDQQELGLLGDFDAAQALRGIVQRAGGFGVVDGANAVCGKPLEKGRNDGLQIRTPGPGNNADGVKRRGCAHAVAILPHGLARVQKILLIAFGAG
jgi:hypothetical protein